MSSAGSPGSGEVGRLYVSIDANTAEVTAGLEGVKRSSERASESIGKGFSAAVKPVNEFVRGVRQIIGSVAGLVGFAALVNSIAGYWDKVEESVKRANRAVAGFEADARSASAAFASMGSGATPVDLQKTLDRITQKQLEATRDLKKELGDVFGISQREYNARLLAIDETARAEREAAKATYESFENMRRATAAAQLDLQTATEKRKQLELIAALEKDNAERHAKYLADLFDEGRLVKDAVSAEREKLTLLRQQYEVAEQARKSLKSAFDADTLSADLGRITSLLQALVAQRR